MISLGYGEMFTNLPCFPKWSHQLPLSEDFLLFSVMVYIAGRSAFRQYGVPGLLGTILRDATVYFFMIFSANFVIAMTLLFTRVSSTTYFLKRTRAERFI